MVPDETPGQFRFGVPLPSSLSAGRQVTYVAYGRYNCPKSLIGSRSRFPYEQLRWPVSVPPRLHMRRHSFFSCSLSAYIHRCVPRADDSMFNAVNRGSLARSLPVRISSWSKSARQPPAEVVIPTCEVCLAAYSPQSRVRVLAIYRASMMLSHT